MYIIKGELLQSDLVYNEIIAYSNDTKENIEEKLKDPKVIEKYHLNEYRNIKIKNISEYKNFDDINYKKVKDKNGKEIQEGSIVEYDNRKCKYKVTFERVDNLYNQIIFGYVLNPLNEFCEKHFLQEEYLNKISVVE